MSFALLIACGEKKQTDGEMGGRTDAALPRDSRDSQVLCGGEAQWERARNLL